MSTISENGFLKFPVSTLNNIVIFNYEFSQMCHVGIKCVKEIVDSVEKSNQIFTALRFVVILCKTMKWEIIDFETYREPNHE